MLEHAVWPSRRLSSRIEAPPGIWVYWLCDDGRGDVSPVQNVSLGGVFLNTPKARPIDSRAEIHFCVQEGQIRTEGIVRHVASGRGLGLRFTAIKEADRRHLIWLMDRLRSLSQEAVSQSAPFPTPSARLAWS
jgi:PilZ domain-containing protein